MDSLSGDANGDRLADLIEVDPEGESRIEIAKTSALGKPIGSNVARKILGNHPLASALRLFDGPNAPICSCRFQMATCKLHEAWHRGRTLISTTSL